MWVSEFVSLFMSEWVSEWVSERVGERVKDFIDRQLRTYGLEVCVSLSSYFKVTKDDTAQRQCCQQNKYPRFST